MGLRRMGPAAEGTGNPGGGWPQTFRSPPGPLRRDADFRGAAPPSLGDRLCRREIPEGLADPWLTASQSLRQLGLAAIPPRLQQPAETLRTLDRGLLGQRLGRGRGRRSTVAELQDHGELQGHQDPSLGDRGATKQPSDGPGDPSRAIFIGSGGAAHRGGWVPRALRGAGGASPHGRDAVRRCRRYAPPCLDTKVAGRTAVRRPRCLSHGGRSSLGDRSPSVRTCL